MDSPTPFGSLLRQHRLNADLTQAGLAEKALLSTRAVQHLEAGRGHPYADTARRLADALGLVGDQRAAFETAARRAPAPRRMRSQPVPEQGRGPGHNLPASLTSFVGRDREVRELREQLATARLLTLFGVGGCGKTRLAVELAREVLDAYPDGAWLVELAPLDGPLVPRQLASVLGVSELPGQAIAEVLVGALRDKRALLVLDNCEHVARACADLADTLLRVCPRLRILATSRSVLGVVGETIWQVPSLGVPAERPGLVIRAQELAQFGAARLFVERARAAAPAFALTDQNADAVARVCRRLEGIPLALELAAARVRTIGVPQLSNRLDDCFGLLVGGGHGRPARQQTLRAAVDWSYDLLSAGEREVFARLSVFAGGCTLEAVEAVCASADEGAVVDVLEQLVDKSLVVAEPRQDGSMRFRLLETLRQYANEHLEPSGAAGDVRARHATYFSSLIAQWWQPAWWGPDAASRLAKIEQELDNLRVALRWLISAGSVEPALNLGWIMAPFWLLSARVGEGRAWLSDLTALPSDRDGDRGRPSAAHAGVLVWAGALATQDADHETGQNLLEEGLRLARASGDELALGFGLMWLALSSQYRQAPDLVRAYAEEGLAVSRAGANRGLEGMNLRILAQTALESGDLMQARRLADDSLVACREAGHPPGVAWALSALGQVHFREGEFGAARALLEECLAQGNAMGAPAIRLNALVYLAWTLLEQGDPPGAGERGAQALELARSVLGGRSFLAAPLEAMAQVAVAADQPELALRLAGAAATLRVHGAAPATPTQHDQLERWLRRARAGGDAAVSGAWMRSQAPFTADEAIAEALALQQRIVAQRALKPLGRMVRTTRMSRSVTSVVSPR